MVEGEAVRIGVQFQIQSKWTSFVAIDSQNGNEVQAVVNKIEGKSDNDSDSDSDDDDSDEIFQGVGNYREDQSLFSYCNDSEKEESDDSGFDLFDWDTSPISQLPSKPSVPLEESKLEVLFDTQMFRGFWQWNQVLFTCINVELAMAEKLVTKHKWAKSVLATALVVVFLELKLPEDKGSWELIREKATNWLLERIGQDGLKALMEKATTLI
ncbi:hypothetical protein BGZ76_006492 [Entomortierella beljakovae]|nr:hypothetical protein BGZ76_006492 [Entomortierella beljakovae]